MKPRDGFYSLTFNSKLYSNLLILAIDETGATQKIIDIDHKKSELPQIKRRKIDLDKPLDSKFDYHETRNTQCLKPGESHIIEDITSVDYQSVDSLNKVGKVLQELTTLKHQENSAFNSSSWMLNWNTFDTEVKNKKYSKFLCNELNFFLYFKDKEYFEEVVKPGIASKMEKTLIDYFLLEDYEKFDEFKHVSIYDSLNALEQCLLIAVVNMTDRDSAKMLADQFIQKAKLVETKTAKKHSKFDTVLLMKILESEEGNEDDSDDGESKGISSKKKKGKKKAKKGKVVRQRSMSLSSNSSYEEFNWAARNRNESDDDDSYGEGDYDYDYEGEGGGGGGYDYGEEDYEDECDEDMDYMYEMQNDDFEIQEQLNVANVAPDLDYLSGSDLSSPREERKRGAPRLRNVVQMQNYSNANVQNMNRGPLRRNISNARINVYEKNQKSLFKEIEKCKQYCETHYHLETGNKDFKKLSKKSEFYVALVHHILETNPKNMRKLQFLTADFIHSSITFTDLVATVALMDLPWQSSPDHISDPYSERGIKITSKTNMIIFKKELQKTEFDMNENIMVIHRFYDEYNKNSEMKIVEFLPQRVYGCQVIITNVSSFTQELQCLWQIPAGSVPLKDANYQKSNSVSMKPYTTETYDFYFYFPKIGEYTQFPTNISSNGIVVAKSREYTFKVVSKRDSANFERFSDLAASGDKEAILKFLKNENLFTTQLKFHMKHLKPFLSDKKFYDKAIKILRNRRIYGFDLWKYSFKHFDIEAVKELISMDQTCHKNTGVYFESSLIKCEPAKSAFRYFEFFPMINPRAHKLDNEKSAVMLNTQFRTQYGKFLLYTAEKQKLDSTDNLIFSSYLLLQDRIEEAIEVFKKVNIDTLKREQGLILQYDYMQAYFDILVGYSSGFKIARKISKHYEDYPVITWRMLFAEIIDQLKEFDGVDDTDSEINLEDIDKQKENLKKSKKLEPTLDFKIEGKKCFIDYTNIELVNIKYYIVNPEILFTRAPFLVQNTQEFSYVKPVYQTTKILPKGSNKYEFGIDDYTKNSSTGDKNKNLIIEADSGSLKVFDTYFPCSLKVSIIENYAELKVVDSSGTPVPQVYIKCFSKQTNGEIKFFKDGYTDMRGKFEYGYSNTSKLSNIEKLSILILSERHGSLIKEAKLPSLVRKDEDLGYLNTRQVQKYMSWENRNVKKGKISKKK